MSDAGHHCQASSSHASMSPSPPASCQTRPKQCLPAPLTPVSAACCCLFVWPQCAKLVMEELTALLVRPAPILLATPWIAARPAQATKPHLQTRPPVLLPAHVSGLALSSLPSWSAVHCDACGGSAADTTLEAVEPQATHTGPSWTRQHCC